MGGHLSLLSNARSIAWKWVSNPHRVRGMVWCFGACKWNKMAARTGKRLTLTHFSSILCLSSHSNPFYSLSSRLFPCHTVLFISFISILSYRIIFVIWTLVSRGDWLGKPANIKVENNGVVGYVGSSLTVKNPLFSVHKLWLNKLMQCFYWSINSKW